MFKKGDLVNVAYDAILVAYNIREQTITLNLLSGENRRPIDELTLPMFIGELGLYLPSIDYAYPGQYLPKDHADYYPPHPKDSSVVVYKDESYTIKPDKDFLYTGKYYLVPVDGKSASILTRNSSLVTPDQRIKHLERYCNEDYLFTKGSLQGVIVYFVVRSSSGEFIKLLPEDAEVKPSKESIIYAYIQDPITYVQYGINIRHLEINRTT